MKKIFLAILLMASLSLKSQARLGNSADEILEEFDYKGAIVDYNKDGDKVIKVDFDQYFYVVYMFLGKAIICNSVAIVPKSDYAINLMVEKYNREYVIISKTQWRMYSNGSIADIFLTETKNNDSYFLWMYAKD